MKAWRKSRSTSSAQKPAPLSAAAAAASAAFSGSGCGPWSRIARPYSRRRRERRCAMRSWIGLSALLRMIRDAEDDCVHRRGHLQVLNRREAFDAGRQGRVLRPVRHGDQRGPLPDLPSAAGRGADLPQRALRRLGDVAARRCRAGPGRTGRPSRRRAATSSRSSSPASSFRPAWCMFEDPRRTRCTGASCPGSSRRGG